ncbi:tRNA N(3)-methylcytidine methyltransferase METTL8, mitochondrial [Lepisosteus oculatus]|uniref:tRNA N(3)-methylcytidine methyltransferase METTL8, mitochondrial n=1 Tax=Lepisosteus oculatus TaxID=7918 RepID=UPI0035F52253
MSRGVSMRGVCGLFLSLWKKTGTHCRRRITSRPPVPLGGRILTNPDDVFQHNTWDHVQWSEEEKEHARKKAEENSIVQVPVEEQVKYDKDASGYWDGFYKTHQNKFFKDRNWLFQEFPEILSARTSCAEDLAAPLAGSHLSGASRGEVVSALGRAHTAHGGGENRHLCQRMAVEQEEGRRTDIFPGRHATFRIFEVGCGPGNSVFPILNSMKDTGAFLYCCDFSSHAVKLVKAHPRYCPAQCHVFVHDVCDETATFPFPPKSLDIILVVFVLSSIHPERMQGVVKRLTQFLKPGGVFLFRDYGRYDMSQLRFKQGRCLSENFYARGDGTCVYFFTRDEVHHLFVSAGLQEIQNLEDRRLQVNRKKGVVMRRVWVQSKYQKPWDTDV